MKWYQTSWRKLLSLLKVQSRSHSAQQHLIFRPDGWSSRKSDERVTSHFYNTPFISVQTVMSYSSLKSIWIFWLHLKMHESDQIFFFLYSWFQGNLFFKDACLCMKCFGWRAFFIFKWMPLDLIFCYLMQWKCVV